MDKTKRTSNLRRKMRKFNWRLALKLVVIAGFAVTAGFYGHETGSTLAQRDISRLNDRIEDLDQTISLLEKYNRVLANAADQAKLSESQWRRRYGTLVANREFNRQFALATQQKNDGIDAANVTAAVTAGQNGHQCAELSSTKSFKVHTPVSVSAIDSAGFLKNGIIVSANGISAVNRSGNALAWFDPKQPVAIRFNTLDGRSRVASGILPLRHSLVVGEFEYRFDFNKGPRGLIRVSGDRCVSGQ